MHTQCVSDKDLAHRDPGPVQFAQAPTDRQDRVQRLRVAGTEENGKERQDGVADELEDIAAVLFDRADQAVEIVVEQADRMSGIETRRVAGEIVEIREEDGGFGRFTVTPTALRLWPSPKAASITGPDLGRVTWDSRAGHADLFKRSNTAHSGTSSPVHRDKLLAKVPRMSASVCILASIRSR